MNASDKAISVSVYDYANRLVENQNPDGTKTRMEYNFDGTLKNSTATNGSITYYKYDGLGRLSEQWSPFGVSNGDTLYSYTKTEYYKNGWKYRISTGRDKVTLDSIPANLTVSTYEYYKNGKVKSVTASGGRKTEYLYDDDGNMTNEAVYTDASNKLITEYTYNYLEKVDTKVQHINSGDIYGNDFDSKDDTLLTTTYTYDRNGNVATVKTPDQTLTTYNYDKLSRQIGTSRPGLDETGTQVTIETSATYNWEGKTLTSTDANNNNTTVYAYNPKGLLVMITDAKNGVTLYDYDNAGRKTSEVSPLNYDSTKSISQMNRVEYAYDLMNRVKIKKDIYFDTVSNEWVTVNSKSYRYDNSGNVVKELDAIGYDYGSGSTPDERISTGYGTEYIYNFANKLVSMTDPVSKERALPYTVKYEYDGLGRKVSETNTKGVITVYSYNDAGNIVSTDVKKDEGSDVRTMTSSTYDLAGRALSRTDANGNTANYEYNALGSIRTTIYPGDSTIPSNTVNCQYDESGNLKKQSDSTGVVDLYGYDNQGRQLSHTQQKFDGQQSITTTASYDENGNRRFVTDGNGVTTDNIYDELNRLTSSVLTVNDVVKTTTYGYDANGNQTTITDWLGNTSTNIYDSLNRLVEKKDPYTTVQRLEYNNNNVQVRSFDALGAMTQYIYDKNNRLIANIDQEGHTTSQSYDDVGNTNARTDGRSITTTYNYDEYNRLISVVNAKSETTSYTYDPNGNMLTQADGNGNTTTYEYNVANKLARKIDQGGKAGSVNIKAKTESYIYYADGSMKTMTDRNGIKTTYAYDVHGRALSQTAGSESISYTYDGNGNQLTMTDSTGITTRTYDEQNRVISKTVPVIGQTTFAYDGVEPDGCYSETTTDPNGNSTKKVFDKAGRLIKVIADGKTTTYEYNGNGSRESVTYPGGATEEYTYYADGLNKTLVNKKADGTVIDSYSYTYDGAHNQTSKTDSKGVTDYTYDSLERLESTTEPNGRVTSYTFDKAGNRLTETVTAGTSAVTTTYTYNEQNRLMNTVSNSGSTTETVYYAYDNNGNMVSKSTETAKPVDPETIGSFSLYKAGTVTETAVTFYEYDVWNQLTKAVTGDKTEKYGYNGEGYRVSKIDNGQTTNYLYESDKVILETDDAGNQTAVNVYGTNLLSRKSGSETLYYMYNGHADVTALIDNTGTVQASYYYDAFGTPVQEYTQENGKNNPIRYAGYQYDGETGLYYLNARYYDSGIARFLSEDTYGGQASDPLSLNLYTYCHNSPVLCFLRGKNGNILNSNKSV